MRFGVGVEGPSDLAFWDKVLHRSFPGCRFDIRNMKNREKLLRETPILYESFKDFHYQAGFILVDRDDDPCVTAVLNHSASFKYFWNRLEEKCRPTRQ